MSDFKEMCLTMWMGLTQSAENFMRAKGDFLEKKKKENLLQLAAPFTTVYSLLDCLTYLGLTISHKLM